MRLITFIALLCGLWSAGGVYYCRARTLRRRRRGAAGIDEREPALIMYVSVATPRACGVGLCMAPFAWVIGGFRDRSRIVFV